MWKEKLEAALKAAREIAQKAKADGRELTDAEITAFDAEMAKADEARAKIKAVEESDARFAKLAELGDDGQGRGDDGAKAKSLGEHYIKSVRTNLGRLKAGDLKTVSAPEFSAKAATDVHTVGSVWDLVLRDVDRTVVRPYRRPLVSDLLGAGNMSGAMVTYFVEGAVEGTITTVAEAGQKPQIHFLDPTTRTDKLSKIAAWWDMSDEMLEDIPFMVSEINNRGIRLLAEREENQLLYGDGIGTNLLGVFNRSGLQAMTQGTGAGVDAGETVADAIYRSLTAVQAATGLNPDGIIINPLDYMALRLAKDANDQYYGGGFFGGQYGNGDGIKWQPPIWGQETVVTSAIPAGTIGIGAFKAATTVYRKGGVRVETTNSDQGKFTKDVVTTRIEERLALAVRNPSAIVELTLA